MRISTGVENGDALGTEKRGLRDGVSWEWKKTKLIFTVNLFIFQQFQAWYNFEVTLRRECVREAGKFGIKQVGKGQITTTLKRGTTH